MSQYCASLVNMNLVCFVVICAISVQSQPLTVTWRGNNITGIPTLIYHDEVETVAYTPPPRLRNPNGPRGLLCSSTNGPIAWWSALGSSFDTNVVRQIYQIIPSGGTMAQIVRDGRRNKDLSRYSFHNGLFTCRRNGGISTAVPVGLYYRGGATVRGAITRPVVSIRLSSFNTASPFFILTGDTEGGPPETYTWRSKYGALITNGGSFSITIGVNGVSSPSSYDISRYRSTLTVTGTLPGRYRYTVSNRATPNSLSSSIYIEGPPPLPTNLMARQNGINSVLVSWTRSYPLPSRGYRINGAWAHTSATSRTISLAPGVHSIRVRVYSQHYPNKRMRSVEVTVKDFLMPTIMFSSLTATSVTITWSQPEGSLAADDYTISLQRLTGSDQQLCPTIVNSRQMTTTTTSMNFTNLQEFSNYTVTFTARVFGVLRTSTNEFTTLSAVPTGAPQGITSSVTAGSVSLSWNEIECIERNGMITNYMVEFSEMGGSIIPGVQVVMNERRFIASGFIPFTNYTFRVAGINNIGVGAFSDAITIQTNGCPFDSYLAETSSGVISCRPCPTNSISIHDYNHNTMCECLQGYYRNLLESIHVPCTTPPSACRNLRVHHSGTRANTITVRWERPLIIGRDDYYYNIHYSSQDVPGNFTRHNRNPFIKDSSVVQYSVSGLRPLTNYTIRVTVHNGVSDQDPKREEMRRCEVSGTTGDIRVQAPQNVASFCSVVVWKAPSRAYGVIIGYDISFFLPGRNESVVVEKEKDEFFHIVKEGDLIGGRAENILIMVRAKTASIYGTWSEGIPLNCSPADATPSP